jgi:hypothetical protein
MFGANTAPTPNLGPRPRSRKCGRSRIERLRARPTADISLPDKAISLLDKIRRPSGKSAQMSGTPIGRLMNWKRFAGAASPLRPPRNMPTCLTKCSRDFAMVSRWAAARFSPRIKGPLATHPLPGVTQPHISDAACAIAKPKFIGCSASAMPVQHSTFASLACSAGCRRQLDTWFGAPGTCAGGPR